MKRIHGGNREAYIEQYGREPVLDFSANLSPLGMPAAVREAAEKAIAESETYPDPECRALRAALSDELNVPGDWLICGNGAADLLFRVCSVIKPRATMISIPCFAEYEPAVLASGSGIIKVRAQGEQFDLAPDFLSHMTSETDLIVLAEPNNPTGRVDSVSAQREIASRAGETGARVLIDESFYDFLDEDAGESIISELNDYPNVVLLRSFTKMYAMAGLRLGFAVCSDTDLIRRLEDGSPAWTVSTPSQKAGIAALKETEYVRTVRELVAREKKRLSSGLASLGLRVVEGQANFILFRGPEDLDRRLAQRGICIRNCADYEGLEAGWFRAGIRTGPETEKLLKEIRDIVRDQHA